MKTHKCGTTTIQNLLFRFAFEVNNKIRLFDYYDNYTKGHTGQNIKIFMNNTLFKDPEIFVAVPLNGVYLGHPEVFHRSFLKVRNYIP